MIDEKNALIPEQGWHCLHLFYRIEFGQWQLLSVDEQRKAKVALSSLVQEIRALESTQLLTLSIVTPKADLGFILITPDLHAANRIEKQLSLSLGADVLMPVYSYLSLTEKGIASRGGYARTIERNKAQAGSDDSSRRCLLSRAHGEIPARTRLSDAARVADSLLL